MTNFMIKDEYTIVEADTKKHLIDAVILLMNEGWEPIGCVSVLPYQNQGHPRFHQSMTRKGSEKFHESLINVSDELVPTRPARDITWKKFESKRIHLYLATFKKGDWLIVWNQDKIRIFTVPAMECTLEKELEKLCNNGYWWIWYEDYFYDLLANCKWIDKFEFKVIPDFKIITQHMKSLVGTSAITISDADILTKDEFHVRWMPNIENRFDRLGIQNCNWTGNLMIGEYSNHLSNLLLKQGNQIQFIPCGESFIIFDKIASVMLISGGNTINELKVI